MTMMPTLLRLLKTVVIVWIFTCGCHSPHHNSAVEAISELLPAQQLIADDNEQSDFFGSSVAVSGDVVLVGAPGVNYGSGAAYTFVRSGSFSWQQSQKLDGREDLERALSDNFGADVDIDIDYLIIGSPFSNNQGDFSGAAYVYKKVGGSFDYFQRLIAADGVGEKFFGTTVTISGDSLAVSGPGDNTRGNNAGAVYVFKLVDNTWTQVIKLLPDQFSNNAGFGLSMDMDGPILVVGAPDGERTRLRPNTGMAYVFVNVDTKWELVNRLYNNFGLPNDRFGASVAVSGNYIAVGAPNAGRRQAGSVAIFSPLRTRRFPSRNWTLETTLSPDDSYQYDHFGSSLAFQGETVLVGIKGDDDSGGNVGGAELFVRAGNTTYFKRGIWNESMMLNLTEAGLGSGLGYAAAMDGDTMVLGSKNFIYDNGLAYAFVLGGGNE